VLGLAWGLAPGVLDAATRAAARFTDHGAYAATVLRGAAAAVAAPPGVPPTTAAWLYGFASAGLAVGLAFVRTVPEGPLATLHSGRIGDYVAWTAVGAAGVAAVFALTLA
jgi:hypothetical protein